MRRPAWARVLFIPLVAGQMTTIEVVSTITAAPTSLPTTGVPEALIGSSWINILSAYTTYYCQVGEIWSTIGKYAGCCINDPNRECAIAVSCLSTSLIVGPNGLWTSACSGASSESVCITGIISLNTEGTDLQTNVQCWPLWAGGAWTATNLAALPTAQTNPTSSSSLPSGSPTAAPGSNINIPSPTAQAKKASTGAIVGGTIGGVALLVFVIAVVFFFCMLAKHFRNRPPVQVEVNGDEPQRDSYTMSELPSPQSELPAHHLPREMPERQEQSDITSPPS